jgi:dephospho-CoA kinase
MLAVGVTGGIGSGKSIVCRIFRTLGIPVYEADPQARRIMSEDPELRRQLIGKFGQQAYSGTDLNRAFLADRIFRDAEARRFVNGLVHPKVREDFRNWMRSMEKAMGEESRIPYVIEEAALLFESGAWRELDLNILVLADRETRIKRIMERDGLERRAVLDRMTSQIDPEDAVKIADLVIHND